MCGRFLRDVSWDEYRQWMAVVSPTAPQNFQPMHDIRPTTRQLVARPVDGGFELAPMRWGLVPFWHRGPLKGFKLSCFNARSETVASAATFRDSFKRRRCLVPARGWYEWTGEKGAKTKWAFRHAHEPWFMFAGLWERCETEDEGVVESFTILTQPSDGELRRYHDRAPIVLEREDWDAWLGGGAVDPFACRPERFTVAEAA